VASGPLIDYTPCELARCRHVAGALWVVTAATVGLLAFWASGPYAAL